MHTYVCMYLCVYIHTDIICSIKKNYNCFTQFLAVLKLSHENNLIISFVITFDESAVLVLVDFTVKILYLYVRIC